MESWLPFLDDEARVLPDLLPAGAQVVLVEPRRIRDRASQLLDEEAALAETLAATWGAKEGEEETFPRLHVPFERLLSESAAGVVSLPPVPEGPDTAALTVRRFEPVAGDPARLAAGVTALVGEGYAVTLCAATAAGAGRLSAALAEEGVHAPVLGGGTGHARGSGGGGADHERVHPARGQGGGALRDRRHRAAGPAPPGAPRARAADGFFDDLEAGSFVVHRQHGVARFEGVTTRTMGGTTRDYLILQYRGLGPPLPAGRADRGDHPLQRRRVADALEDGRRRLAADPGQGPRRGRRGGGRAGASSTGAAWPSRAAPSAPTRRGRPRWRRRSASSRPRTSSRRSPTSRPTWRSRGRWTAWSAATSASARPRWRCGPPSRRCRTGRRRPCWPRPRCWPASTPRPSPTASRPTRSGSSCSAASSRRPSSARWCRAWPTGASTSSSAPTACSAQDVQFKDLGLLVVDEEQRFGVTHKEAVKRMAEGVDVLTLTASPIPRTLEMALTGIRDLSMVNTPPADRRPILTYVGEHDPSAVSEALRRELLREGQVFYVHNRVSDIDRVARDIRALVPEARVAIAHGQMDEGSLETVVLDFWERRYDVLVCTTIIESGIDMPSVNTLIVDRADLLGLGQLHQIRGRVGRSGQRAYAYLFHPADRVLSEQAYERLRTIGEHTELGSGFKIAMRDLEIRGAGNLLGSDQSGHIAAVGYDLYVQLVAEAVAEARGEARPDPVHRLHRRAGRRPPAQGLRGGRGRPPRGVPPAGRGDHHGRRRRHRRRVGGPLRPAARPRPRGSWPWPGSGPAPWRAASARSP